MKIIIYIIFFAALVMNGYVVNPMDQVCCDDTMLVKFIDHKGRFLLQISQDGGIGNYFVASILDPAQCSMMEYVVRLLEKIDGAWACYVGRNDLSFADNWLLRKDKDIVDATRQWMRHKFAGQREVGEITLAQHEMILALYLKKFIRLWDCFHFGGGSILLTHLYQAPFVYYAVLGLSQNVVD